VLITCFYEPSTGFLEWALSNQSSWKRGYAHYCDGCSRFCVADRAALVEIRKYVPNKKS